MLRRFNKFVDFPVLVLFLKLVESVVFFRVLNDAYYTFKFAKINLNHENKSISNKEN